MSRTKGAANQSWPKTIPSGHSKVKLKPTGKNEDGSKSKEWDIIHMIGNM